MCGIYGFQEIPDSEGLSVYETSVLTYILASEMERRGTDSFGSVTLPDGKIYKGIGRVSAVGVNTLRAASTASAYLGHTRAATVGNVTIDNSHPFEVGNVIGVHNGSIYNYDFLNKTYNRTCQVDSEHIFYHLNEGLDLTDIQGHGTFFWTRKDEECSKIYFAKTVSGQLTIGRLFNPNNKENPKAIIWSSEFWPVTKAAKILGLEFEEIRTISGEVYSITGNVVEIINRPFNITSSGAITWTSSGKSSGYGVATRYKMGPHGIMALNDPDEEESQFSTWTGPLAGLGNSSEKTKRYEDTTNDEAIERSLVFLAEGRKLSRKERKALRRTLAYFREKNDASTVYPFPELLHNGVGLNKHFVPTGEGKASTILHCNHCNCDIREHVWGWCQKDTISPCKAAIKKGCDTGTLKICSDCGHFLVNTVHELIEEQDVLVCTVCQNYCLSDVNNSTVSVSINTEDEPTQEVALQEISLEEAFSAGSML